MRRPIANKCRCTARGLGSGLSRRVTLAGDAPGEISRLKHVESGEKRTMATWHVGGRERDLPTVLTLS